MNEKLENFFKTYPLVKYKRGEVIFHPEDTPSGVFQIESGYVRLYSISQMGEELTLLLLKPNDFFPTRWAFGDFPMRHVLGAFTEVVAHKIPKEEFLNHMKQDNELLYAFTHKMVARISTLYDRMNEMAFGTTDTKIASILRMCAAEFGEKKEEGIEIQVPLTHNDIANLVGISRESASLQLKQLERKGVIATNHHLITVLKKEEM